MRLPLGEEGTDVVTRDLNGDGFLEVLYRGVLADLQDTYMDGLPDGAYGVCRNDLDPDVTDNRFADEQVPPSGQGFFYLMSRVRDGAETELGATSAGLPRVPALPCAFEK